MIRVGKKFNSRDLVELKEDEMKITGGEGPFIHGYTPLLADEYGNPIERPNRIIPDITCLFAREGIEGILDVPIGFGRDAFYLARRGFKVTGIDIDRAVVDFVTKWKDRWELSDFLQVRLSDFRDLRLDVEVYGAVISIKSIGALNTRENAQKFMHAIQEHTGIEGYNVITAFNCYDLRQNVDVPRTSKPIVYSPTPDELRAFYDSEGLGQWQIVHFEPDYEKTWGFNKAYWVYQQQLMDQNKEPTYPTDYEGGLTFGQPIKRRMTTVIAKRVK